MVCSPVGYYQLGRIYPRDLLRQRFTRVGSSAALASVLFVAPAHVGGVYVGPDPGRQLRGPDPGRRFTGPDPGREWRSRT
jgi:hypothetical protein